MRLVTLYAIGRGLFGAAALLAPTTMGRLLAGDGATQPDAKAFLRGMGGREIGLALGLLVSARTGTPVRPWLMAGLLADSGDITGIAGAWPHMTPAKRRIGLATAGGAALAGAATLIKTPS
jgi:hypothetical protein